MTFLDEEEPPTCVIIGGGAAGFFGAITAKETAQENGQEVRVVLLERSTTGLAKVKISGGGRCNVTHSCFDPKALVQFYPRGHRELMGPFHRFQPRDTIEWYAKRGVELHTEADGRMFPVTNSSQTIVDCLVDSAQQAGVEVRYRAGVQGLERKESGWLVHQEGKPSIHADRILLATGSHRSVWDWVAKLGHAIVEPVPSLFTCVLPGSPLCELAGVSVDQVELTLPQFGLSKRGPVVLTHWGMSGPAVLRLSAWAARFLHSVDYQTDIAVDWVPGHSQEAIKESLIALKGQFPNRCLVNEALFGLSRTLWKLLMSRAEIPADLRLSRISNKQIVACAERLKKDIYAMKGKSPYKEEFVTCGGVPLDEVDLRTMESKICPGLYFAGEVLNIDGETGGFNFQSAWTTSHIAGKAMARSFR